MRRNIRYGLSGRGSRVALAASVAAALALAPAAAFAKDPALADPVLREVGPQVPAAVGPEGPAPLDADEMPVDDEYLGVQGESLETEGDANTHNMWRLYNPNSGEHFYTASDDEMRSVAAAGWWLEGVGWVAPSEGDPVYRLYNRYAGDHHYTMSKEERDLLIKVGWTDEGVGWASDAKRGRPVLRQYNPCAWSGSHNYTTSQQENDGVVSLGWRGEGVGWYAADEDPHAVSPFWLQGFGGDVAWVGSDGVPVKGRFSQGGVNYYGRDDSGYVVRGVWITPGGGVIRAESNGSLRGSLTGNGELDSVIDWLIVNRTGIGPDALRNAHRLMTGSYINQDHLGGDWWNWSVFAALEYWHNGGGNCYRFAGFEYWLVRGIGYEDVSIVPGKVMLYGGLADHAWVEIRINGVAYAYDPEIADLDSPYAVCLVPYDQTAFWYYTADGVSLG